MSDIPSTLDRADGLEGRPGIATPVGSVQIIDNGQLYDAAEDYSIKLREAANSPEIERAEQATITHTFYTDWDEAIVRIQTLGRGTLMVDSFGNVSRVLSSKIQRERGGSATLTVTAESVSFDSPPDEFSLEPVELGVHIVKHPRYFHALDPTSDDASSTVTVNDVTVSLSDVKQSIIRTIQNYMDAPFYPGGGNVNGMFQTNIMEQLSSGKINVDVKNNNFTAEWDGKSPVTNGVA
jgi:hypothetical protein